MPATRAGIEFETPMGGTIPDEAGGARTFTIQAAMDRTPLAAIDIVKGHLEDGAPVETVHRVATFEAGKASACVTWADESDNAGPAYWYARVIEAPSRRWSKHLCERLGLCDKYPDADRMVQDRAWSSPVWYLPR